MTPKQKFLNKEWSGWTYIWIDGGIHELYKNHGDELLSWTASPVSPPPNKKMLEDLIKMVEDGLLFTEEELMEHNRSIS